METLSFTKEPEVSTESQVVQNSHFNHCMKRYCEWHAANSEFNDYPSWCKTTPFLFRFKMRAKLQETCVGGKALFHSMSEQKINFDNL